MRHSHILLSISLRRRPKFAKYIVLHLKLYSLLKDVTCKIWVLHPVIHSYFRAVWKHDPNISGKKCLLVSHHFRNQHLESFIFKCGELHTKKANDAIAVLCSILYIFFLSLMNFSFFVSGNSESCLPCHGGKCLRFA